ncbi:MAG: hypothetical protein KAX18_09905 [Candidatus Lokiarchaeota archaeon]|nr:hypothetical protein [Candidatus Lokiarchaeota archaeon]
MEGKVSTDMKYYDFLYTIQNIAQQSHVIQEKTITQVYQNYDICRIKSNIDRQIEHLDGLLSR